MTAALVLFALAVGALIGVWLDTIVTRYSWRHLPDDRFEETVVKIRDHRRERGSAWKSKVTR